MKSLSSRGFEALVGGAAILSVVTFGPPEAEAGTYRAAACEVEVGAFTPETAVFSATESGGRFGWGGSGCSSSSQPWLTMGAGGSIWSASPGSYAEWLISAPPGVRFRGGYFQAFPTLASGVVADYRYRVQGQAQPSAAQPITGAGWFNWPPQSAGDVAIDQLILRTVCASSSSCFYDSSRHTPRPGLNARYFGFEVEDYAQPAAGTLGGALMEGAAQRGTQLLAVPASDVGSGVAEVEVRVNSKRYASQDPGCKVAADGRALRLSPCPTSPTVQLPVETTNSLFSEGLNAVEVCVSDYAQETNDPTSLASEACTSTGVYVDNSCDVSQAADAAELRFGFGKRARDRLKVRYGHRPRVAARLVDAANKPIEGATVCVSTRDRVKRAGERDIAEVATNRRGVAKVRLPRGASRTVKLTYWRDQEQVDMETVKLNVRARPKLRIGSKRKLSDGAKARFRVKLIGPYRARRDVAVQALAPAGWLNFPGCEGKTNQRGVYRCSYKFREQSGNVTYRFRAIAPRQSGYPYLQGHTRSEKVIVRD